MTKKIFSVKKGKTLSNKNNETNKKFTLSQLVLLGFNYTCGISFTAVYTTLLLATDKSGSSLGLHIIWIFLIEGFVAGVCAWAFARLSRLHPAGNGAAYIYIRTNWGRFWGWLISILQYSLLPIVITSQILSMIRLNFVGSGTFLDTSAVLGSWASLVWDIVGVAIFLLVSSVIFFGIKKLKRYLSLSSYLKWGSTGLLFIALLTLCIISGTANWEANKAVSVLNINNFSSAFTSCFFFFLGFETYATIGNNVVNPEKNISRSIIWTICLATIFYVVTTVLMLGALSQTFTSNPNLQIFQVLGEKAGAWIYYLGVIIMLICTIALKANSGIQNALYAGATLQPHAEEGVLPEVYAKLDKDNLPTPAAKLNILISFIFACVWLFIPDIVQGAINSTTSVIPYSALTSEVSLIMIIVYIGVILTVLKLGLQKKMKIKIWEFVAWTLLLLFLIWQFIEFFINVGETLADGIRNTSNVDGIDKIIASIIELLYFIAIVTFAIVWYFTYYRKKYLLRMKTNPQLQAELNNKFYIVDDWDYVLKVMYDELKDYTVRNKKIYDNKENKGLNDANQLLQEISRNLDLEEKNH